MKQFHKISILLFFILSFFGCRKKELSSIVDQDRIYMDYYLSYNDFSNKTYATAHFFLDNDKGKRVELSQNSRVYYGGIELVAPNKRSTTYAANLFGYVDSSEFVWNDVDDRYFYNTAGIPSYIYANNKYFGYWFNPWWGYDFYWEGDSVGQGETVTVSLRVDQDTTFTVSATQNTTGRNYVHFTSWDTELLMGRMAYVTVSRRRIQPIREGTAAGGMLTTSYRSEGSWLYGY